MRQHTPLALFWFRRDLRLEDNAGLYHALSSGLPVLPVFILDSDILDRLDKPDDARILFICAALQRLKDQLEAAGSSLLIAYGKPEAVFASWTREYTVAAVYTNHDYEPYARKRDQQVAAMLDKAGIRFHTYKDQVIFDRGEVVKDDGQPYTVFTPYSRKWLGKLNDFYLKSYPSLDRLKYLYQVAPFPMPGPDIAGFRGPVPAFQLAAPDSNLIAAYQRDRDYPGIRGTSRMSVHLRFGTVSIRVLASQGRALSETWLKELIWRDFYMSILYHFPHVVGHAFKPAYDRIPWRNNETEFAAWCAGHTGYPIVDAGMRELNATGFMHNRVRMITASFLCKHLLIDWRWGEAYFAAKLMDYDLAANNGGWQWAAGSGCDAAPYFRIFNPYEQTRKFDPELTYIRRWVPELDTISYPAPIVDHQAARERALRVYKTALNEQ